MKPKIFISYSRTDSVFVQKLGTELQRAELSAWLDVHDLKPGTEWQPALEKALRSASAVVVCLSPKSANSSYVTFEWSYAMGAGVKVIPVLVKETSLHPWLGRYQWIDLSGPNPPWNDLIAALKTVPRSRRTERRTSEQIRTKDVAAKSAQPKTSSDPKIVARFELVDGKPVRNGDEYSIALTVENAPAQTARVSYELHDDSFDKPRFHVEDAGDKFEAWISSYGDVRVSAAGGEKGKKSRWTTDEMLSKALRIGHGDRPSATIRNAIATIEKY